MSKEEKLPIMLYVGDTKVLEVESGKPLIDRLGVVMQIYELISLQYDEILQRGLKFALQSHLYDSDGKPLIFLDWCDDYLLDLGSFSGVVDGIMDLGYVFYVRMTKYKPLIKEIVFDQPVTICITNTERPLVKKIVNYIKNNRE